RDVSGDHSLLELAVDVCADRHDDRCVEQESALPEEQGLDYQETAEGGHAGRSVGLPVGVIFVAAGREKGRSHPRACKSRAVAPTSADATRAAAAVTSPAIR